MKTLITALALALAGCSVGGKEYHVSPTGNDQNTGSQAKPFQTISAAAQVAQPGDVITVHEGVYRERINPPRGGESDDKRIVYQAAPGEKVVIKGSEVVKGWQKVENDTWKVTISDTFFGDFNPFKDKISGDWFNPFGRVHHTGAVYVNGHWLREAAKFDEVMQPAGDEPLWYTPSDAVAAGAGPMLNVAWLQPDNGTRTAAEGFAAQQGVKTAPCSEGGKCIGWIEAGDWVCYKDVDFGAGAEQIEIRAAAPGDGGRIELRLGKADGELLGTCTVDKTGDWQKWASFKAKIPPTSGKQALCLVFRARDSQPLPKVDENSTTIWAQFNGVDPNKDGVEINARQTVFYPAKTGVNYITVRGFTLEHAATPWAPPTAEQVGLIGTHWSKGWIIENNTIRYSKCTGLTLGKHGDEFDNTSQNSAEGYVETINRALKRGWSKENIGHHIVRNNHISHCEQAGIVGSMGPVFCTVTGNIIHDINYRGLFGGAEMGGIKFHGAIDTIISNNHIYRSGNFGIWLDWMTQGTRVTGNLVYDCGRQDLFVEMNHGPFLIDNNIFLSPQGLLVNGQGGAFVHNIFAGDLRIRYGDRRLTPYHQAHSTEVAALHGFPMGDDRYYNNIFAGIDMATYDAAKLPMSMSGNVYVNTAKPGKHEADAIVQPAADLDLELIEKPDGIYLRVTLDKAWGRQQRQLVTTATLGKAKVPDLPFEQPDGSPYRIDADYFGHQRNVANPFPGPFEPTKGGKLEFKVWPTDK